MQLVGIQIYNLDIARIKKQYKEMKFITKVDTTCSLAAHPQTVHCQSALYRVFFYCGTANHIVDSIDAAQ